MDTNSNDYREGIIAAFTGERERKMLEIRRRIQEYLHHEDWSAVEAMIRGLLYADKELAVSMIAWAPKLNQEKQTLLHDLLDFPVSDPPIRLLQLVIDIAPNVLLIGGSLGNVPLEYAIYNHTEGDRIIMRSFDIIKLLVEADSTRETLHRDALDRSVWRGDVDVTRYLLSFPECRRMLLNGGKAPVYFPSKYQANRNISPFLRLLIEATSDELTGATTNRSCCLYSSVQNCAAHLYDANAILEIVRRNGLYCSRQHSH